MGMALGAVADNGDVLALDEINVGITIILDTHIGEAPFGVVYSSQNVRLRAQSEMVKLALSSIWCANHVHVKINGKVEANKSKAITMLKARKRAGPAKNCRNATPKPAQTLTQGKLITPKTAATSKTLR